MQNIKKANIHKNLDTNPGPHMSTSNSMENGLISVSVTCEKIMTHFDFMIS